MFNLYKKIKGSVLVWQDYLKFKKQFRTQNDFSIIKMFPIVQDKFDTAGILGGAYFHQDLLVARRVHDNKPNKHIDIGSRIDGFVAHVASYREIEIFDIRPFTNTIKNITFTQMDLMVIPQHLQNYCDSISSLHVLEHFGLGRYGDEIDVNGHLKGLASIYSILQKGGKFYFSTPIGPHRIEFNAHRVFSVQYLINLFQDDYTIDMFSFVDDAGDLHENVALEADGVKNNFGCHYGCGIFEMTKK